MQKQIENHQYLKSMKNLYSPEICLHCHSSSLIKIDKTVYLCQSCDTPSGFDDSMSFYDFENFLDGTSVEEFQLDINNNAYVVDQNCSTCGNTDPNTILLKIEDDSKEISFFCDICKSYISDDVDSKLIYEDENNNFECDKDNSCFKKKLNREGTFPDYENAFSTKDNFEDDISYNGRVHVDSLYLLTEGCHVAWHRPLSYWHHGIVTHVFIKSKKIEVIHFSSSNFPTNKGTVLKEVLDVDVKKDQMYRFDYNKQVYSNRQVVERAESKLGQTDYYLFKNNCEHFANWCKTGVSKSAQVSSFKNHLIKNDINTKKISILKDNLNLLETIAVKSNSIGRLAKKILIKSTKYLIVLDIANETKDIFKDIKKNKEDYNCGKIEKNEFMKVNIQRIFQGVGTTIGAIASFTVPFLNNSFGFSLSKLIGKGVGNVVGRQLSIIYEDIDKISYEKWLTKHLSEL